MRANDGRPMAVSIIGWGAIAVGILMLLSGGLAGVAFLLMPEPTDAAAIHATGFPEPLEFVFRYFAWFAGAQALLALVLIAGGRALLRLRKWGGNVVLAFSIGLLVYAIAFTGYFVHAAGNTPGRRATEVATGLIVGGVVNLLVWGIPLSIAIRRLASARIRAILH